MSIQEVIDKLTVLPNLLPVFSEIDGYERYGKMLFPDKIEYLTTSLKISSEEAQEALNLIDSEMSKLKSALLSLSQQDAKV